MNLPIIVDVVIGLVFIYLILSLLAAEIQELVTTILQWRAKHLKVSIINLLSGDINSENSILKSKQLTEQLYSHPLLSSVNQEARGLFALLFRRITWVFSSLYQSLIGGDKTFGTRRTAPSYISAETFSMALIEQLDIAQIVDILHESKFQDFHNLILKQDVLNKHLSGDHKAIMNTVRENLNNKKITLESAIDQTLFCLDHVIQGITNESEKEILELWKNDLFRANNQLAILSNIRPSLIEITEAIDGGSQIYQNYKEIFERKRIEKSTVVYEKIQDFLDDIIPILAYCDYRQHNSSEPSHILRSSFDEILSKGFEELEVIDNSNSRTEKNKKYNTKIPLCQIAKQISKAIQEVIIGNEKYLRNCNINNFNNLNCRHIKLLAFYEGFTGINRFIELDPNSNLGIPSALFFLGLSIILYRVFDILNLNIVDPLGGATFLVFMFLSFGLSFSLYNKIKKHNSSVSAEAFLEWKPGISPSDLHKYLENSSPREVKELGYNISQYLEEIVKNSTFIDLPFLPSSVKKNISSIIKQSQVQTSHIEDQTIQISTEIGKWFDDSMERASGVYKRNAKGIAILIGFLLALITNANSIYMIDRLAYDQELRQAILSSSERLSSKVDAEQGLSTKEIRELNQNYAEILGDVNLPIGWDPTLIAQQVDCEEVQKIPKVTWKNLFDTCLQSTRFSQPKQYFIPTSLIAMFFTLGKLEVALLIFIGWLLTGVAISMGASFWFDLLGKLMSVRNTGAKALTSNQAAQSAEMASSSQKQALKLGLLTVAKQVSPSKGIPAGSALARRPNIELHSVHNSPNSVDYGRIQLGSESK